MKRQFKIYGEGRRATKKAIAKLEACKQAIAKMPPNPIFPGERKKELLKSYDTSIKLVKSKLGETVDLPYDRSMLFEDVKFPLAYDSITSKMHVLDSGGDIIAIAYDDRLAKDCFNKVLGEYKENTNLPSREYQLTASTLEILLERSSTVLGEVFPRGKLYKKKNPEKRQLNIANYLLYRMNS